MNEKRFINICDSTLRDGSYGIMHQYTKEQVTAITRGLVDAGVKLIEVGQRWRWRFYNYIWTFSSF